MNNFFDYKEEKITERAFSQGLLVSVISILLCIVALCSITYAWFTEGALSSSSKLSSGTFDISVSVIKTSESDGSPTGNSAALVASDDGSYKLCTPGVYTVTLNPSDNATVKGYCVVTFDADKAYRTDVILNSKMVNGTYTEATSPFIFTIAVDKADTAVVFEPHWGVLAEPDIEKGENVAISGGLVKIEKPGASE